MELPSFFRREAVADPPPRVDGSTGRRWGSSALFHTHTPRPSVDSTHYADSIFRIALVGEGSVGKTTLTRRWIDKTYEPTPEGTAGRTIGVDFKSAVVDVNLPNGVSKRIKLQLWDTAGQERFRSIV